MIDRGPSEMLRYIRYWLIYRILDVFGINQIPTETVGKS